MIFVPTPIQIKQVMDKDGDFSHLELHQKGNVIELSLMNTESNVMKNSGKWGVLKQQIQALIKENPNTPNKAQQ